jgi:hypothetical protein
MGHTIYKLKNEQKVDSVTTIIGNVLGFNKEILMKWTRSLAFKGINSDNVKKESATIGTAAHYLVESKMINQKVDKTKLEHLNKEQLEKVKNAYKSFVEWEKDWKPDEYVHNEIQLVSENHKFGGTIDIVAKKDNNLYILDNKTSNSLHIEMIIQLGAYKILFEENFPEKIYQCGIIKIEKEKINYNFKLVPEESLNAGMEIFLNALKINELKNKLVFK